MELDASVVFSDDTRIIIRRTTKVPCIMTSYDRRPVIGATIGLYNSGCRLAI